MEGMDVEFAEIGQSGRLAGGEAQPRRLDLQRFFGEFQRQPRAGFGAIPHPCQRAARRGLAIFAQRG